MTFEQALEAWVRKHAPYMIPEGAIAMRNFEVTYEEGWSNDSGTSWPADITVRFQVQAPNKNGAPHWYKKEASPLTSDPVEFMRELFEVSE